MTKYKIDEQRQFFIQIGEKLKPLNYVFYSLFKMAIV